MFCRLVSALLLLVFTSSPLWAEGHWAYKAPVRPWIPTVREKHWPVNPIDYFILAELERAGISRSPRADTTTLARRLSLDLTGLPADVSDLDRLAADTQPDAIRRLVDGLLASPRYGERFAQPWLDLARYADTHGYLIDSHRDMWRWREWVIDALNKNMPFDQFTIEQLAGDLLPNATLDQRIATGFNRNHMVNFENGAIAEQYRAEYVADRVATTATVWLGQTLDCARCHDHPYDPFSTQDYYRLFAFFNNVDELGLDGKLGNAAPTIAAPTGEQLQRLGSLQAELRQLDLWQATRRSEVAADLAAWEQARPASVQPPRDSIIRIPFDLVDGESTPCHTDPGAASSAAVATISGTPSLVPGRVGSALLFDGSTSVRLPLEERNNVQGASTICLWLFPTAIDRGVILSNGQTSEGSVHGFQLSLASGHLELSVWDDAARAKRVLRAESVLKLRKWQQLTLSVDTSAVADAALFVDGEPTAWHMMDEVDGEIIRPSAGFAVGAMAASDGLRGMIDEIQIFGRVLIPAEVKAIFAHQPIDELLAIPVSSRSADQQRSIADHFLAGKDARYARSISERKTLERAIEQINVRAPTVMVMQEASPRRETFVLTRGQYDQPAEKVFPGIPTAFANTSEQGTLTRLDLAHWIADRSNPLTARVVMNRLWQHFFGSGLVRTADDFGSRGDLPSHPELLDWLAVEFMESGWDMKHMVRLIVTSQTYCQSSRYRSDLASTDPDNRLLARASRPRLDAEQLRDQALFASGLLDERIGGPSVFPYQPPGLWEEISYDPAEFTAQVYEPSRGPDLYRRSLYTFWKRTLPPPTLQIFDAPTRERCSATRSRTNTPLQALVLMNEPLFVEAARKLAERMILEGGDSVDARASYGFRIVAGRVPDEVERDALTNLYHQQLVRFQQKPDVAAALLRVGARPANPALPPCELAAWATVSNVILSSDEVVTRN